MGGQLAFRRRIIRIARRQHGVVTNSQLGRIGASARRIEGLVARGELWPLFRGVYRVGAISGAHSREHAALLACGDTAVLSHASAAYLYGLLPYPVHPADVDVTVGGQHRRQHPGIRCHRSSLRPHEIRERLGIPVTSPVRTLIDLAASCAPAELEDAVAEAFALNLTNLAALRRATGSYRGRRGVARLRELLEGGPSRSRSQPERVLLRAIRAAGLPDPETNVRIGRWEVDFLWRDARLVVEVDGYSAHSSPRSFERDRLKDSELAAAGLGVQRFTAARIDGDLGAVTGWIAERLTRTRP